MFITKELKVFIFVAMESSVKKAAYKLNISSPAVSMMLKKMEGRLGYKLFLYRELEMRLTRDGEILLRKVYPLYRSLLDIEESERKSNRKLFVYLSETFKFLESHLFIFLNKCGYIPIITSEKTKSIQGDIEIVPSNINDKVDGLLSCALIYPTRICSTFIYNEDFPEVSLDRLIELGFKTTTIESNQKLAIEMAIDGIGSTLIFQRGNFYNMIMNNSDNLEVLENFITLPFRVCRGDNFKNDELFYKIIREISF